MLFISPSNSIGFARRNELTPNRENRLSYEEKYASITTNFYRQKFRTTDDITIQVGSDTATVPTILMLQPEPTTSPIATLKKSYTGNPDPLDDRYYFEFNVNFSDYSKQFQIRVTQGTDVFLSEYVIGEDLDEDLENGFMLKLEATNSAEPADYFNFMMDYSTGISHTIYIEAVLHKPEPSGEDEITDSKIGEQVLLEAEVFRDKILATDFLPEFLTEKIHIFGKHFGFFINDLRRITLETPDVETGLSNHGQLTWTVRQRNTSFNTDNKEIELMNPLKFASETLVTSKWSFTKEKEYMLHTLFCNHDPTSAATYQIKVGTSDGGDDLLSYDIADIPLSGGLKTRDFTMHYQGSKTVNETIFVEITSLGAAKANINVTMQLSNPL